MLRALREENSKLRQVLADHLARHGIASLRYDERGVGASTGRYATARLTDFAADVHAAFSVLQAS